jgi:FMN phosphatase YigB (HAD superfamily)
MDLLKGIKNIIFDFGGVIINIDYHLTIKEFQKLGIPDFELFFTQHHQEPWFDLLDKGGISGEQFVAEIKKYLPPSVSNDRIISAWNAMLLDFPSSHIELLNKLKTQYRIFLLSNTNEIHLEYYFGKLKEWYGINDMSPFFEKEYYSHIIGKRKPDTEIFEIVLSENGLKPDETLFIDDNIQNTESAVKCGIRSFFLQKPVTILDVFPSLV